MNFRIRESLLAVAVSGLVAAPLAHATNGYFMHGYGSKEKGMAGAGVAYNHNDAMAAATNPAAMAFVDQRVDVGLQIFSPSPRKYTSTGTASNFIDTTTGEFSFSIGDGSQSIESENDFFLLPHGAINWLLNDKTTIGLAVYGNGGMNTEYVGGFASVDSAILDPTMTTPPGTPAQLPGTFGAGTAGINLEQMFFNFNSSYKLNPRHALGGSLIVVGQRFRAQGLEFFGPFSSDPTNLSGNVNSLSWGLGAKVGYQGEVADGVRVGISYQSKISMSEFDEYKGLFAEGGDFDIPSTYTLGVSFDVGQSGVIVADYQRINYSDVASIANPFANIFTCNPSTTPASGAGCLGASNGAGFGWEDIGIFKLGYQWNMVNMDWRVGYSHADQAIPESEVLFNILAPATVRDRLTFGLTKEVGKTQEFNFAFMYALNESVTGPNAFDPPNEFGTGQTIEIEMSQIDIQAGWAWKF
jgi:long-chain fatty acid transport protein